MITIGAIYRGPELRESRLVQAVRTASEVIGELRDPSYDVGTIPWVNPIFIVQGSLGEPGFRGLIYGKYSKRKKGVVVQIAVFEDDLRAGPEHAVTYGLHGANAMAFEFFRQKGECFPLADAEQMVAKVRQRLGN
ncbi:hypothetical protein [Brevundimonas sp.]|uniref:hypothetical protein n=1 Tax=Brevundimonas sp. TaxID=1871086 RepID=UPI0028A991E6|nr:hypothetical protein [Brevundimonas sp.]